MLEARIFGQFRRGETRNVFARGEDCLIFGPGNTLALFVYRGSPRFYFDQAAAWLRGIVEDANATQETQLVAEIQGLVQTHGHTTGRDGPAEGAE